jgi:LmbE family N-acetylglucosaminyl deacetylase
MDDFLKKQRLLVVAPHADDETICAGGLMARVKKAGGQVYVIVMTVADLDHFDNTPHPVLARTRREELAEAMKVLGVDDHEILIRDESKHLRLDTIPRRELVNLIEREGRLSTEKIQPTMMVLPAPSYNQDHGAVYRAGLTACRPHLPRFKAFQQLVLVGDAPQLAWNDQPFQPNFYVDITAHLDRKIEAYRCHRSQQRPDPHQAGAETLAFLARMRGREISVEAAEAFRCMRFVL